MAIIQNQTNNFIATNKNGKKVVEGSCKYKVVGVENFIRQEKDNLSGVDFSGLHLKSVDFTNMNLLDCCFDGCILQECFNANGYYSFDAGKTALFLKTSHNFRECYIYLNLMKTTLKVYQWENIFLICSNEEIISSWNNLTNTIISENF